MEANKEVFIPKKFSSSFKYEIQRNTPLAKTTQESAYFNEIYKISFELENNKPLIQNKLAQIGLSEEKSINLILTWLKDMHEFYKSVDELIESQNLGNIDDHNEQMVINWKFELFIHKKYLTNSLITAFLDQNYDLEINNPAELFQKLNEINSIIQFEVFKQKAIPLLLQITDFDDHSPEKQNKILRAFFHRNLCFDLIKSSNIENLLENKQLEICLDILYGNIEKLNLETINPLKVPEQSQQKFSTRLTNFLNTFSKKFQGWKDSKKKQLIQRLFKQVPNYDYEEIVKIILEYKLKQLSTKELITDEVLMKIFNLPSTDFLQKQKAPKSQVILNNNLPKNVPKLMMEEQEDFDVLGVDLKKKSFFKNEQKECQLKLSSKIKQAIPEEENGNKNKKSIAIQQQSIQRLKKQIQIIRGQTKNKYCIEIALRQLQIAMRSGENQRVINEKVQNIRTLVNKYHLRTNCFTDLDQIEIQINSLTDRLPKVSTVRSKLYVINLIDVLEGKNQIENKRAAMCKDAKAILIIGRTGAGKSTLMTALAGFKLILSSEGDFRAQNKQIAKVIPISNRQESQTRWANVQKLAKIYSNGKEIVIIDTPGFQDNRGVEIQITNNIATVNLIKKLESARILIVLPQQQFYGARQIQNYTKFVKLFSAYFFNVKDFQYCLGFVLTKGLTAKQLLKTIGQIEITETFTKIDWSINEKNFQNIMKRKLKELRKSNEIIDPSKHQFDSMMEQVMELQEKQSPGDDICESFSPIALQSLQQTYNYNEKMVKETFEEGQFSLTTFYLNNIKQLDSIQKSNSYHQVKSSLKQEMEKKVKLFRSYLKKFLSSNNDEWLNQLKSLRDYFHNPESQPIYKLLYYNELIKTSESNPKQIFDAEIKTKIQEASKQFSKGQKMDSNKKMEIRSTLKMMKSFGFEIEYQQINSKILNSSIKNQRKLENILNETELDEQQWKNHVEIQLNQFKQNQDLNCSEAQKYEEIKKIVEKYISNNNQFDQIMNLKDKAMTQCLDGKLSKICSQYLTKLNKIKETHYSVKQIVEPKFKQILHQLDILITKYEDKQVNDKTINPADFQLWENLNENREEIFSIKAKFADSQVLQFINIKQEESMLKLFFNNLNQNIDNLKNMVTGNIKNVQHIDPDSIRVKLETIFGLLDAMEKKKSAFNGQYKQKDRKQETLIKTLEKSYEKIKAIINSIERTCSIQQVRNYEGNLKLMNSLTVIIEFREFRQKIHDEKVKQKIDSIYNAIILKLQSPLKNIENDEFVTLFSFEKLLKVLQYTKQLDEQTIILSGIANNFDYNFDFRDNPRIRAVVSKCLQKVKNNYANLSSIQELSNYGSRSLIKSTSKLEQQKKNNIENLEYDLLEEAIKYIKSYKYVRLICDQFSNELSVVEEFMNQHLQMKDLKITVKKRIKGINEELSKKLSLDSLNQIAQEFNFFRQIHLNTKSQEESEYNDIKNKIKEEFIKLGKNFNTLYDEACELYKDVENDGCGVDYSSLNELLDNPGRKVEEGEQKFNKLLFKIDMQYEKILTKYYIEQDPNSKVSNSTNVFLNIIEFKKICQNTSYNCKIKEDLHKLGLQNLFSQVANGFESLLEDIKKGKVIDQKEKNLLIRYEKKIALLLKTEYDQFKAKREIKENYFMSFEKRKKEIMEKFIGQYSKKDTLEFDENFLEVYQNVGPQVRESMRKIAISKNDDDVDKRRHFLDCDHECLISFYSEKMVQAKNMPQQIFQKLMEKLKPIINQITQMEEKTKQTVQQAVQKKVPTNIVLCFLKGDTVKNESMKKIAVEAVKNYFQEEQKTLDFNNIQNLEENLERNLTLTNKDDFKNAAKKNAQFSNASLKYVKTAKNKFQARTKTYDKQVHQFKEFMRKRKMGQSFQLSDIKLKPNEYEILSNGVKTYKTISKYNDIFDQEIDNFKKVVSERINQGNNDLKESVLKLESIKRQLIEKKVNNPQSILSTLEQVHSKRVVCDAFGEVFNELDNFDTLIQQKPLNDYDTFLTDIKSDLKQKYNDATNWNLDQFIDNQMIVCNSKQNEQKQKVLNLLDTFMPIFFDKNAYPSDISKNIQKNTQRQFYQFEKTVLEDIDNFFIPSIQCQSEKVMRYYKLASKMKESRSLIFSQDMRIDNKVKEKLLNKFKMNVNEINAFIEKPQKIAKYNQFLAQIKNIDEKQKKDISEIQKKTDVKIREQCREIQEKIESEKSTIGDQDSEKSGKLAKLDDQCKADKLSKQIDLNSIRDKEIEKVKKENSKLKQKISNELNSYLTSEIINQLIVFQRATTYFYCEREIKQSPYSIKLFTKQIQDKYKKTIFRYIYTILKNMDNKYAQTLTNQKCFESISISNWRELVAGKTFETLMKEVPHLDQISKKEKFFNDRFKKFQEIFAQLTKIYKDTSDFTETKRKFVEDTKIMGLKISETYKQDRSCKHQRWELVARIAAVWTIHRSSLDDDNNVQFIHKPHPGQILATFMLLQFDEKQISPVLKNTMVQVSTGEGKSVILGILSTYLALIGFKVYQACYSSYLSQRDYDDFADFFNLFGVKDKIFYRTFPEICRMMLEESPDKPFIEKIERLLINPSFWNNIGQFLKNVFPGSEQGKKVLLIDEADAFLDENYLGESFFPSINIKKKSVENLLDFVWSYREKLYELTPQLIIKSQQFDELCKQLSNKQFRTLMQNQTHAMVRDLGNYKEEVYSLIDGEIYYKTGDSLTNKIHYGYRTVFNYYHEFYINKRISKDQFEKHVSINLIIASFSYSKLPSYFSSILGVTGTLDCMSDKQKKILTDKFGVKRTFVQPSIYPPNRRVVKFSKCSEDKLFKQVAKSIQQQHSKKRPIVVFFETKNNVYDFYNSEQFSRFKMNATIVTHEVKAADRTFRIGDSTSDAKITLLTVDFSRGTDFKLNVKNAEQHPGLHVICAFIPNSFSDYLQVVGRTGRQGKNGTVNLYFVDSTLPQSTVSEMEQQVAEKMIRKLDNDHWENKYKQLTERMKRADEQHVISTELYSQGSSADKIFKQMLIFNKEYPIVRLVSRTVIGIDATSSMGPVFQKLITVIQTSLPIIRLVIEEAKVAASFEIKFVVYRNYNSKAEDLIGFSNFQSKTQTLADWLKQISVSGGWGNEALEVCFQHINSLENVNQYVIISDAKGNLPNQVKPKREHFHGNSYFEGKGFPLTSVKEQIQKLKQKNIKGHFYYLNPLTTSEYYKKVAESTEGIAQQFPINNKNSSKIFGDFISERILENIGSLLGGNNADNLLQRYKARAQ